MKLYYFRITKYDPKCRNDKGVYEKKDWTSVYDVGKSYEGIEFDFNKYKHMEEVYIRVVINTMRLNSVDTFFITDLEKNDYKKYPDFSPEAKEYYDNLKNTQSVPEEKIDLLMKLILRELVWCKLSADTMFVHFGYDYYMYIGSAENMENQLQTIVDWGVYPEIAKSPYL